MALYPYGCNASFIRHTASFIASQFYCASHSVIRFASFKANKITLNPQDSITLLFEDNNITLPQGRITLEKISVFYIIYIEVILWLIVFYEIKLKRLRKK